MDCPQEKRRLSPSVSPPLTDCQGREYLVTRASYDALLQYPGNDVELFSDVRYSTESTPVPTLRQYLKEKAGKKFPASFLLTKIWFPKNYPSFGLECDLFKVSIKKGTLLYPLLDGSIASLVDDNIAVAVKVVQEAGKPESLMFLPSKEEGYWAFIRSDDPLGMEWNPLPR